MLSSQGTARKTETRAQPRDNTEAPAWHQAGCSRHTGCELRVPLCSWHFPFFPDAIGSPHHARYLPFLSLQRMLEETTGHSQAWPHDLGCSQGSLSGKASRQVL